MRSFRQVIMMLGLILIILLILLSVYGAFIGDRHAKELFNSIPLAVYWLAFTILLLIAILSFPRLLRLPPLLLIHTGCILILAGGLIGSEKGHQLQKRFFQIDKIPSGRMIIYQQGTDNQLLLQDADWPEGLSHTVSDSGRTEYYIKDSAGQFIKLKNDPRIRTLPFDVRLTEFRTEYYSTAYIYVRNRRQGDENFWEIPAQPGTKFLLSSDLGSITVLKIFENCKIRTENAKTQAFEDPGPGSNPAVQVRITYPDGSQVERFVFERFPGHGHPEDKFDLTYQRTVSDWISSLQVIKDNKVLAQKNIEVNHPLHYAGYNFYQHSYDSEKNQYTVLLVTSDTGLGCVYTGYLFLTVGIFWHFWLRPILKRKHKASQGSAQKGDAHGD